MNSEWTPKTYKSLAKENGKKGTFEMTAFRIIKTGKTILLTGRGKKLNDDNFNN